MRRPRPILLAAAVAVAFPLASLAADQASAVDGIGTVTAGLGGDLVADYPFSTDWHTPDGNADMVFSFTLTVAGAHTITRADIGDVGGWWLSTGGGTPGVVGVVTAGAPGTLQNSLADGSVSLAFNDSIDLRLHGLNNWSGIDMPQDGASYALTVWVDGTTQYSTVYTFPAAPPPTDTTVPSTSTPDTTVAPPGTDPGVTLVAGGTGSTMAAPASGGLPTTGSSDPTLLWVGGGLLLVGTASTMAARRGRDGRTAP